MLSLIDSGMLMTCEEATNCSRAVYFEVEEDFEYADEYPYYQHGSSFICKSKERFYIVTANHVIEETDNPERLFVLSEKDDETILIPDYSLGIEGDDKSFKDIRVYRIDEGVESCTWKNDAIPISKRTVRTGSEALQTDGNLILSGFPGERQYIDLDRKVLGQERVVVEGKYESKTSKYRHRMRFFSGHGIESTDGFSGSPVLCRSQNGFGISGITIWGGSDGVQFVDSVVLYNIFNKFHEE